MQRIRFYPWSKHNGPMKLRRFASVFLSPSKAAYLHGYTVGVSMAGYRHHGLEAAVSATGYSKKCLNVLLQQGEEV